jgi:hypothetical protein
MGGRNATRQPSSSRGQSSDGVVSAAARTGPRAAAQTGAQFRPLVREPVVGWTPRRRCLRGGPHGAAVDDGGVGSLARATARPCRLSAVQVGPLPAARPGVLGKPRVRKPWPPAPALRPRLGPRTRQGVSHGVIHTRWGKGGARAAELTPSVGLRQGACWGSTWRSQGKERPAGCPRQRVKHDGWRWKRPSTSSHTVLPPSPPPFGGRVFANA